MHRGQGYAPGRQSDRQEPECHELRHAREDHPLQHLPRLLRTSQEQSDYRSLYVLSKAGQKRRLTPGLTETYRMIGDVERVQRRCNANAARSWYGAA